MKLKSTIRKFDHIILLFGLLTMIALPIFVESVTVESFIFQIINLFIIIAGLSLTYTHLSSSSRWSLYFGQFLFVISVIDLIWLFEGSYGRVLSLLQVLFFMVLMSKVFTLTLRVKEVDSKVLIYALSGYILLGIIWGVLISVWLVSHPGSFSFDSGIGSGIVEENYFAFVTLTTLGYGDLLPLTEGAKAFSILISISGTFYMTMVMGIIVGKYVSFMSTKENN